jgi:hypothetical protein
MAFDHRNLVAGICGRHSLAVWHYTTSDPLSEVRQPGYFPNEVSMLQPGHIILVVAGYEKHVCAEFALLGVTSIFDDDSLIVQRVTA